MIQMRDFECHECGEDGPHLHPRYSDGIHAHSDHLCDKCLIICLENLYDEALDALRAGVDLTGEPSITLSFIEAAEKRE